MTKTQLNTAPFERIIMAQNLAKARDYHNISQSKLSQLACISKSYISDIERLDLNPGLERIAVFAFVMGFTVGDLFNPLMLEQAQICGSGQKPLSKSQRDFILREFRINLAQRFRERRQELGYSLSDIERFSGGKLATGSTSAIELGKQGVSCDRGVLYSRLLEISPNFIFHIKIKTKELTMQTEQ